MTFAASEITAFRYRDARIDRSSGLAEFEFAFDGGAEESFTERVQFTLPADASSVDWERVDMAIPLLGAALSLSYFKAAAPPLFIVEGMLLTATAMDYLRSLIRNGLAEFSYRAGLPGLLEPEVITLFPGFDFGSPALDYGRIETPAGDPLVPIGGGKDSVVSVESLAATGFAPIQFAVNPNSIIKRVATASGHPLVSSTRTLDPRLLELNDEGALNGHVPVTAMNSLIAVIQSLLLGAGPVVMSNESSASDPTLEWNGEPVNHQWSKSLAAERELARALESQAGLRDAYFSLLRPFSELRIARGFATTSKYDASIVSCNRAFRRGADHVGWCGDCDKCRFVFLAFAPYMSVERLTGIIGKNMFEDASQLDGYRALLGLDAHKPFECVGEEAECTVAASLLARMPEWASSLVVTSLVAEVPNLADGDPALEASVLEEQAALPLTPDYEAARHAIV